MWLVSSMGTAVDGQGTALDECLVARFVVASVGALIGMYSVMALEIGLAIETLCDAIDCDQPLDRSGGTPTSTTEVELSARDCLPLGTLHAIRIERAEQPCR